MALGAGHGRGSGSYPNAFRRYAGNAVPDRAVPVQLFMLHKSKMFEGEQSVDKTKQFLQSVK